MKQQRDNSNLPHLLFHRDFTKFTGGHLKVWDYFNHTLASKQFTPKIYFTPQSIWENNPWCPSNTGIVNTWNPEKAQALFLAGMDWLALTSEERSNPTRPIINLIQHVRHADSSLPLYNFLEYPAVRICVSRQVQEAIESTGRVNGEIITIPNGIPENILAYPRQEKTIDLLIVAMKNQPFSKKLTQYLARKNIKATILSEFIPQPQFHEYLAQSYITILLPNPSEGFYLPAIEGMALGTLVICPDCIGNRDFCIDQQNCYRPNYDIPSIESALSSAINLKPHQYKYLIDNARKTAESHCLNHRERDHFSTILEKITRQY